MQMDDIVAVAVAAFKRSAANIETQPIENSQFRTEWVTFSPAPQEN